MDSEKHHSLLWIAREALKADLPSDWKLCQTPDQDPFYFNFSTAESSWEHPCDTIFKQMFRDEKRKLSDRQAGDSKEGSTPRCDGEDALAGAEQLEGCLRRAMQLDLLSGESAAIVRANVADGLLGAAYYAEWWTERVAEHSKRAQEKAARDAALAKQLAERTDAAGGSVEAALDRLTEAQRWKLERYLERSPQGSPKESPGKRKKPNGFLEEEVEAGADLQGESPPQLDFDGLTSPQRRERTSQYIARRLLSSDSSGDEQVDEESGHVSTPATPVSSAGSDGKKEEDGSIRSSMEWIPGGLWVASMIPDLSAGWDVVGAIKEAVSPRGAPAPPKNKSVLPVFGDDKPPARQWTSWLS